MDQRTICIAAPAPAGGTAGPATGEFELEAGRWCPSSAAAAGHPDALREVQQARPDAAERLAEAVGQLPEAGTTFRGFRLLEELGRGAFGRVFLARQGDLAGRPVVLKVAADVFGEARALAQLLHTNIVPVYSVHRSGALQAVCMPYLGATTLADVVRHLRGRERMPHSGMTLVSTLQNRKAQTRRGSLAGSQESGGRSQESGGRSQESGSRVTDPCPLTPDSWSDDLPDGQSPPILAMLEGLDYVQSVLWLVARLADGLAHAHDRGILHRDLKPANILLSDEGQPMLLDFGVAEDTKLGAAAARVGGTLPYMAPEHLDTVRGGPGRVTAGSDVYSLGVILYELLTGRHPFPAAREATREDVARMIADRSGPAPSLRARNKAVTPAVEAIVRKCLEPDPARRYQSARALMEDVQRHLQDLPLRHASEPSLGERTRKWVRRHPKVASSTSVAAVAAAVLLALATGAYHRNRRLAELEAAAALGQFRDEARAAQLLLNARADERRQLEEGVVRCRRALDGYGVMDDPNWLDRPAVRHLSDADRDRLRGEAAELMLLMARAVSLGGAGSARGEAGERLQLALRLNERAEATDPGVGASRALWAQRAELTRLLGGADDARRLADRAAQIPLRTVRDRYLAATEHAARGRYGEAVPLLQEAVQRDPRDFWCWFALGQCQYHLGRMADAVACDNAAVALWPEFPWAYFNRGLARLRLNDPRRAAEDFDEAVRLDPGLTEPYLNRAVARQGLRDYAGAVEDLTRVLDRDPGCTRAYFMRARARELAGDAAGARRDVEAGMRHEPADEHGWVARGLARLGSDPAGALADFDKALEFNPRSLAALQNKAHVLGKQGKAAEAAATLDRAVALYPDFVPSRAGRGVYHARLGHREAALADARAALLRDTGPANLYQVAGIYALTSRQEPADRREAFRLLATALRGGFGFDLLDADRDLDPVRDEAEFRRLVEAARSVRAGAAPEKQ